MIDHIDEQPAGSLRSRAVSEIRSRIQRREIPPEFVMSEAVVCAELGMSRAPVREALIVLAGAGWIDPMPRAGWQVRAMTLNEARDLLAVRAAILPLAIAAAARRAPHDEETVRALVAHLETEEASPSPEEHVVSTYRCLRRMARCSGNPEFDRSLEDILGRLVRYYLLDPVRSALQSQPLSLRSVVESVIDGCEQRAGEAASQFVALDAARMTGAIIDSELIQSMKLTPSASGREGANGVRRG